MQTLRYNQDDFERALRPLFHRTAFPQDVEAAVRGILESVREDGDAAVVRYAKRFDEVDLTPEQFRVAPAEVAAAAERLPDSARVAIDLAHEHVAAFARQRLPEAWRFSPRPGVTLGEQFAPLDRVAAYVPGGTAPLVSTVLHTITIAQVAGVPEIVVTTPPGPTGRVNPAILYAAHVAGATEVYRLGGVYAVGALAYGTKTVPRVEKIVGPGNAYVTAAKRLVYGYCALDLVAGPSEIMVIADRSARADFVAADLLSQAEHGSGAEQAVLVTPSARLIEDVAEELELQRSQRQRTASIDKVIANGTFLIEVADLDQAADIASRYAPEHLELMVDDPEALAPRIRAAGAIFLGPWTPEPIGDFVAGPSHVLPTGGAGRYFSGLSVEMFCRRMSVVQYDRDALGREADAAVEFGRLEGLDAHARSAAIRVERG